MFHLPLTCSTDKGKTTRHTARNSSPCSIPISIIPTFGIIVKKDIAHNNTA